MVNLKSKIFELKQSEIDEVVAFLQSSISNFRDMHMCEKMIIAEYTLKAYESLEANWLFADMMSFMDESIVELIKDKIHDCDNLEDLILLNSVLCRLGQKYNEELMMSNVKNESQFKDISMSCLSLTQNKDLLLYLYDWLRKCELGENCPVPTVEQDYIVENLRHVVRYHKKLPSDIEQKLTNSLTPKVIKDTVDELWP